MSARRCGSTWRRAITSAGHNCLRLLAASRSARTSRWRELPARAIYGEGGGIERCRSALEVRHLQPVHRFLEGDEVGYNLFQDANLRHRRVDPVDQVLGV